jgi:hypothetical protein
VNVSTVLAKIVEYACIQASLLYKRNLMTFLKKTCTSSRNLAEAAKSLRNKYAHRTFVTIQKFVWRTKD